MTIRTLLAAILLLGAAPQEAARRPNILVVIADDQSWIQTSACGAAGIRTPAFDRVASRGVLFTRAFSTSPGCSPSRASLLTGRYPWQLEEAGTHAGLFRARYAVYPDLLEESGYAVGMTGKGWGPGNWKDGGRPRNPAGPEFSDRKLVPPYPSISDVDYAGNFAAFLERRSKGQPFCFWLGSNEPHRDYSTAPGQERQGKEKGCGLKLGKKPEDMAVPPFLPDLPEVRSDLADHAAEIEWFDGHLARVLKMLEEAGELEDTFIVVTADNGMPFPRAKANVYEYGFHVPLAVSWPRRFPGGRKVDDPVGLLDLTPTILEAAGVNHPGKDPMEGRSLTGLLEGKGKEGLRPYALSGRERHNSARKDNLGYPCRAIRTADHLYIRNFKPDRWPAGESCSFDANGTLNAPHSAYWDIDPSPSLEALIARREDPAVAPHFQRAVGKRPAEELYAVEKDPGCLNNLAADPAFADVRTRLAAELERELRETGDTRLGENPDIWETYRRYLQIRKYP